MSKSDPNVEWTGDSPGQQRNPHHPADGPRDTDAEPRIPHAEPTLGEETATRHLRSQGPFCLVIHPVHGPLKGIDAGDVLVDAVARTLWRLHGDNEPVNRLEAAALLDRAMRSYPDEVAP